MTENPFNKTLDWALRGKRARVREEEREYLGWIDRVHHGRGSVVMHDVETGSGEHLAAVFVRNPETVEVVKPGKRIEYRRLEEIRPHPEYPVRFTPRDVIVRRCRRNGYAGSFPVVRENGEILNGHKRVKAARVAGLERHPVEVVAVTDEQALELLKTAHRSAFDEADDGDEGDEGGGSGPDTDGG